VKNNILKMKRITLIILLIICNITTKAALNDSIVAYLNFAEKQFRNNVLAATDPTKFARSFDVLKGNVRWVSSSDWTAGFYPGLMWLMYEYTADDFWRTKAMAYTAAMNGQQYTSGDHDIGFKVLYSMGNAWKYTQKDTFSIMMQTGALKFEKIYNPTVGCTRSWFHTPNRVPTAFKPTKFPVIIDNMMNVGLFLKATQITGDNRFRNMALQHASTTAINHIRPDSSTYHVVEYEPLNGTVRWRGTQQGFDHESTWSRGQAWGIYGYTALYNETNNSLMLQTAEKLAKKFIRNIPSDNVVYYDFSLPDTVMLARRWRDVSANAIAASAYIDLYQITSNSLYLSSAENLLIAISAAPYRCTNGTNGNFILTKSTGGKDYYTNEPVNYADYYYVEALLKYAALKNSFVPKKLRPEIKNDLNLRVKANQQLKVTIRMYNATPGVTQLSVQSGLYPTSATYNLNAANNEFSCICTAAGTYNFPITITENGKIYTENLQIVVENATGLHTPYRDSHFVFMYTSGSNQVLIGSAMQPPFMLLNMQGLKLIETSEYSINTASLSPGMYFVGNKTMPFQKIRID
jgi:unsaturated chondroitin disaccharide hydrolase